MPKFVSKPVEVEAMHVTVDNIDQVIEWLGEHRAMENAPKRGVVIEVETGPYDTTDLYANVGEWVVIDVNGEPQIYSDDFFNVRYMETSDE